MIKSLLKIKWENILLMLFIPVAIIQFMRAGADYKILSILMSITMYGGTYYAIRYSRREKLATIPNTTAIDNYIYDIKMLIIAFNKSIIANLNNINDNLRANDIIRNY